MSAFEEIKDLQEKFEELFENIYGHINKVHGETDKADELTDKAEANASNEMNRAIQRKIRGTSMTYPQGADFIDRKRNETKNKSLETTSFDTLSHMFDFKDTMDRKAQKAIKKSIDRHNKKMSDNNSLNIMTQILDLTEAYANLLEAQDARGGAQKEVNKITRTKKDKNGEPVEVVSVADELFPYKGTAKEQYNQKILAKINDMIEGTATLEDLIQLIRQKKAVTMKESLEETLNQMMAVTEALTKSAQKWYDKVMDPETTPTGGMQLKVYTPEQAMKIAQGMSQMELDKKAAIKAMPKHKKNAEPKQQANQLGLFNDNNSLQETLDKMMAVTEEIISERNKENRKKKEKWELKTNHITKKEKKAIQDYAKGQGDEAKYHQMAADDYDHIYSQQPAVAPNGTRNSVADYFNGKYQEMLRNKGRNEQNIADEVEPLTKKLKNREHKFHDMVRGFHDPNLNH